MPAAGSLDSVSPAVAVLAGLVSFVSPCVLPLVPAYVAYLGSRAGRVGSMSVATAGLAFVAGLSLIFIAFFYLFSLAVQPIRGYVPVVAGVIVIVMAAHVAGLIRIPFLDREYRVMSTAPSGGGAAGGFLLGLGFASGWTPCIGVTLGAVLSSAVTAGTTGQGLALMVAYDVVTTRMKIGRRLYALGGNEKAARLSGIKTERLAFLTFVNMGALAALAGLVFAESRSWCRRGLRQRSKRRRFAARAARGPPR